MFWKFSSDRPIYTQLIEKVEYLILSGELKPSQKIPSVREFADIASVNPNTMQKALSELEKKQLIITQRTSGKFITDDTKLIEQIKNQTANSLSKNYIFEMNKIGYSKNDCIDFLNNYKGE